MRAKQTLLAAFAVGLAACAPSTFEIVKLPKRQADLYPISHSANAVAVAVDHVRDSARAKRYFGRDLTKHGIMPVIVIVSNAGDSKYTVKPSDVLMRRGSQVIDPLPIEKVTHIVKRNTGYMGPETERRIENYFGKIALSERILQPGDTYQGVIFFYVEHKREPYRYFRTISLFTPKTLKLHVVVNRWEDKQRIEYGPFTLYTD